MADDGNTPEARFWAKVAKGRDEECWPWLASHNSYGYGSVKWKGRPVGAHRVAYMLARGAIAPGLVVRHTCDSASCTNPLHLVLGTVEENNADRLARGRYSKETRLQRPPQTRGLWKRGNAPRSIADRFADSWEPDESGCWMWKRAKLHFGHGAMTVGGKVRKAHRVSYELHCGPIPNGAMVLHRCDVPSCVNPAHLRVGSHEENMADMSKRGRAAKGGQNHFSKVAFRGRDNARARLTEDAVREIRAASKRGDVAALARKYGITRGAAGHVRARRSWKHVI